MKRTKAGSALRSPTSLLALCIAVASPAALAQQTGWYIGASAGESRADMDADGIVAGLRTLGYNTLQIPLDDDDIGGKVFGGYSFTPYLALEGSYFDLGDFDYEARVLPSAVQTGRVSVNGFALDLVGTLPLRDNLAAFAKVGLNDSRLGVTFDGTGPANFSDRTDRETRAKYGVGLQYAINDAFSVRAELERYRINDNRVTRDKVDTLTIGVVYRFGATPTPAPVVQQPAPAPAPPPPPPPPPTPVQITLEASTLFDFDRAELRPQGRERLDALVADMEDVEYDIVVVTGHTDRIGSRDYNLGLSERRANTVRDYLIQAGVPAANITARGVNSDQPVTTAQQCTGPVTNALIACLQPDRRVEVEINGTREPD